MFQELFQSSTLLDLPVVVLVAFFATFVGVVLWVTARRRGDLYQRMSAMPLDDSLPEDPSPESDSRSAAHTGGHSR